MNLVFDGDVRCTRSRDGSSMQLHGRSAAGGSVAGGAHCDTDFIWQHASVPDLPAHLSDVRLTELASSAQSPRRFDLHSQQRRLQFPVHALQIHRAVGETMFAAIPPQSIPRWLRAAWWLLLSVLRLPGVGRLLLSSRGAA